MAVGDVRFVFGSSTEAGTLDLTNLSNDTLSAATAAITLTGTNVLNVLVQLKIRTATTLASGAYVAVWAAGSLDSTNYTLGDVDSLVLVGIQQINTADTEEWSAVFNVARAFGGTLPPYLKLYVENRTGSALKNTSNASEIYYATVYANVAAS